MPNILDTTSDAIELLNLDQLESGAAKATRVQIGYATFRLLARDLRDIKSKLAMRSETTYRLVLGKCRFTLTAEGRDLLLALVDQAVTARATYEQRQQQKKESERLERLERLEQQRIEDEWRNAFRGS